MREFPIGCWDECYGADEGCGGGAEMIEWCAGTVRATWHGMLCFLDVEAEVNEDENEEE